MRSRGATSGDGSASGAWTAGVVSRRRRGPGRVLAGRHGGGDPQPRGGGQEGHRRPLHLREGHRLEHSFGQGDGAGVRRRGGRSRPESGRGLGRRLRQSRGQGGPSGRPAGFERGCRGQAEPGQAAPEPLPRPGQPALDRPDRPPEDPRGVLAGPALEVAEDDRAPGTARGAGRPPRGASARGRRRSSPAAGARGPPRRLIRSCAPAPGRVGPGVARDPEGDAVEPARQRVAVADRAGLAGPGRGTSPGRRPGRRGGRRAPPGRPGGPSARAARPGPRRPGPTPRRPRPRTAPGAGRRSGPRPTPARARSELGPDVSGSTSRHGSPFRLGGLPG